MTQTLYTTLISTTELAGHLENQEWAVLDCRFNLAEKAQGQKDYLAAHIPGAIYADLESDLSGPHLPGQTGRHPLPAVEAMAKTFSSWGIGAGVQVVCYDDTGGALAAARAWWLLRWLGHEAVAVLDGGWQKWLAEGRLHCNGRENRTARLFIPKLHPERMVNAIELGRLRLAPGCRVFDSRSQERYHGLNETIDPVAGHIPGARSAPYAENLNPDLTFKPASALQERFLSLLEGTPAGEAVFYCGSGVTAAHNILAMVQAGLEQPRLYAGSWSDWITDPQRPVEV